MSHEFLDYLEDIVETMDKAELLVEGVTFDQIEQILADYQDRE